MAKILVEDKKLNNLIRRRVVEIVQGVLADPDFGLELQKWVKKRLKKKPRQLIPFETVKKNYE